MRSAHFSLRQWLSVAAILAGAAPLAGAELFRDDFDGNDVDPNRWICKWEDWSQKPTLFRGYPSVQDGYARFHHHTYFANNPNLPDPNYGPDPNYFFFVSQEIESQASFALVANGLEIEARVRIVKPVLSGLVAGVFTYMDKIDANFPDANTAPRISDEIDYEFLTTQINDPTYNNAAYCGCECDTCHPVFAVTYDEMEGQWFDPNHHCPANPSVCGLDLGEWNVFKIRWYPDCVEWYWQDANGTNVLVAASDCNAVPDEPMCLYLNFWASNEYWHVAWNPNLHPTDDPNMDVVCYFDVDYVAVRTIDESFTLTLDVIRPEWGQVAVEPNLPSYRPDTIVTLTAEPNDGRLFAGWTGDVPNGSDPCPVLTLRMDSDKEVTATFKCGVGANPMLPLSLVGLGLLVLARRGR